VYGSTVLPEQGDHQMTYDIYEHPAQAQADDLQIVSAAITLARFLRDDMPAWCSKPIIAGVARTIRDASRGINDPDAELAVWRFGSYVVEASDRADLDDLICDYLGEAQRLVEQGYAK
jgi:hypothetical protein